MGEVPVSLAVLGIHRLFWWNGWIEILNGAERHFLAAKVEERKELKMNPSVNGRKTVGKKDDRTCYGGGIPSTCIILQC